MTARSLPRLSPATIARPRIETWLARHARTPLRLLAGSPGTGKTTAAVRYLAERPKSAYVGIRDGETAGELRAHMARAFGSPDIPESYAALVALLAANAPCEVFVDDADRLAEDGLEDLKRLPLDVPEGIALIYALRSRGAIDAHQLLARGLAVLLDGATLAFDAEELAHLAERLHVTYSPEDVAQLAVQTEGWPIAASYVLRDCADSNQALSDGYDRWRGTSARYFAAFVLAELNRGGDSEGALFRRALQNGDPVAMEALETRGLFVRFVAEGAFQPYRVAAQLIEGIELGGLTPVATVPLLNVRLFGRFEASVDGRSIAWIRRRDAQVFKYLLLKPGGAASRAELVEQFWPGADDALATQSLRTVCSNIRKALAPVVGPQNVERYFGSRGDVVVDLSRTVLDVRRFSAHVQNGDAESARGRIDEALDHYLAADRLYRGDLFGSEHPEPWYAARVELYKSLYRTMLERLIDIYSEANDHTRVHEYQARLEQVNRRRPGVIQLPLRVAAVSA